MKIVRFQAQGFKRLVAVDITPEGDLVEVRGNNAEGKSSLLDAIKAAIGGAEEAPVKPVRTGEEYAVIKADLGDLKVTRYFDGDGTSKLKVENAEGAVFSRGQATLDALVGRIAFDPLAFARMKPVEQAAELRRLVPLSVDLDALAKRDREDTAARRDVNRDAKALLARVEAIEVSGIVPEARPDRQAIVDELAGAAGVNAAIERERGRRANEVRRHDAMIEQANTRRERAFTLRKEADKLDAEAASYEAGVDKGRAELDALPALDTPVDTSEVSKRLATADRDIALLDRIAGRQHLQRQFAELEVKSKAYTAAMAARAEERAKALAAAEMPVDGLSFDTFGDDLLVTYQGEPFSQASGAQQLRVSMALAMAANPKLRVMIIKDGSLLDAKGLALVREMAAGGNYQVWMESVGDEGSGIIMEAGAVRGAPEPAPLDAPKRRKPKAEPEAASSDRLAGGEVLQGLATEDANKLADYFADEVAKDEVAPTPPPAAKPRPRAAREFTGSTPGDLFGKVGQ